MKTNLSTFILSFCLTGVLTLLLISAGCRSTKSTDADSIAQAVQATLTAWPTSSPVLMEVTRIVEVSHPPETAPVPAPSPAPTETPAGMNISDPVDPDSSEAMLLALINQQRAASGLSPLTVAAELNRAARRHSNDMAAHDLTNHAGSDGSTAGQRIREAGYPARYASEAIFYGTPLPAEALDWWLKDTLHRDQLLSPHFTEIGLSYTPLATGRWQHYWTITLGHRADAIAQPVAPTSGLAQPPTPETVVQGTLAEREPVANSCPTTSTQPYDLIPMTGADRSHPDYAHGDLNLALRGYTTSAGVADLVAINGPTDGDAPSLTTLFGQATGRSFTAAYQVNQWNWACGGDGCRGEPLRDVEVSLVGIAATPGEAIYIPRRHSEIYNGGYLAAVLYADANRLTLAYTRDGSVANGYAVHLEGICVDPNLLTAYRTGNAAGRDHLPALRNRDPVGQAAGGALLVAVRDRGAFLDPRSRKDWWR